MTVSELIEKLRQLPQDYRMQFEAGDAYFDIDAAFASHSDETAVVASGDYQ